MSQRVLFYASEDPVSRSLYFLIDGTPYPHFMDSSSSFKGSDSLFIGSSVPYFMNHALDPCTMIFCSSTPVSLFLTLLLLVLLGQCVPYDRSAHRFHQSLGTYVWFSVFVFVFVKRWSHRWMTTRDDELSTESFLLCTPRVSLARKLSCLNWTPFRKKGQTTPLCEKVIQLKQAHFWIAK